MNKRQKKKSEKAQDPITEINKLYRKTAKETGFKTQKSTNGRQQDFTNKQKIQNKKRVSFYLDFANYKKVLEIQNNHFIQHKKKISRSDSINVLLNKI